MKTHFVPCLAVLALLVASCTAATSPAQEPPVSQTMTLSASSPQASGNYWALSPGTDLGKVRKVTLTVNAPTSGDLFFVFTNTSTVSTYQPLLTGMSGNWGAGRSLGTTDPALPARTAAGPGTRLSLSDVIPVGLPKLKPTSARSASDSVSYATSFQVNDTFNFIDALWGGVTAVPTAANVHPSTLRKQVTSGVHTLNVWVADDCWSTSTSGASPLSQPATATSTQTTPATTTWHPPTHLVNQTMVDALAARFLGSTSENIYSYVTTLLGAEWPSTGAPTYPGYTLVDGEGNVHIFVTNLNPNGTSGGILLGYFHSLNNLVNSSSAGITGSNQKILFAVDADSLANPKDSFSATGSGDASWAFTDAGPAEIVSTLAHEFQHMIHFYQKQVVQGLSSDTDAWVNEMGSMMVEDLVADKLGVAGPRGVPASSPYNYGTGVSSTNGGRLPGFDAVHSLTSLTGWGDGYYKDTLDSYANAYAFGAWLLRNYGGPALVHDIVTNRYTDYQAVVSAVNAHGGSGETFASLVRQWGLATLLMASTSPTGLIYSQATPFAWTYPTSSTTYRLGSIDLGKYAWKSTSGTTTTTYTGPAVYTGFFTSIGLYAGASHFLFDSTITAGDSGILTLTLPADVAVAVVVAP